MYVTVQKYKSETDDKLSEKLGKLTIRSTKKKFFRLSQMMVGTQVGRTADTQADIYIPYIYIKYERNQLFFKTNNFSLKKKNFFFSIVFCFVH